MSKNIKSKSLDSVFNCSNKSNSGPLGNVCCFTYHLGIVFIQTFLLNWGQENAKHWKDSTSIWEIDWGCLGWQCWYLCSKKIVFFNLVKIFLDLF